MHSLDTSINNNNMVMDVLLLFLCVITELWIGPICRMAPCVIFQLRRNHEF